jgi:dienelactone hydrolase
MVDAIDFVAAKAKDGTGVYAQADITKIAAAGQSCGGLEALDMKDDPRVSHIGVFNSGYLQNAERAATIKKPTFYFLGGSSDIAYANVSRVLPWRGGMALLT